MNKTPNKDQFDLKQVKVKDGVVEFKAALELVEGNETFRPELNDKYPIVPHKDLTDALMKMREYLAICHGLLSLNTVVKAVEFKLTNKQLEFVDKWREGMIFDINVTGISLSGQDGNRGVVITGTYDGQAINSKRIKFSGTSYGFEEELEGHCKTVIEETYEFVFNGKKAQLDIFDSEEPKETEEVFDGKMAAAGE